MASDSNRHILRRALRFSTSPQKPRKPGKQFLEDCKLFRALDPGEIEIESKAGHKTIWALTLNCEALNAQIVLSPLVIYASNKSRLEIYFLIQLKAPSNSSSHDLTIERLSNAR